MNTPIHAFAARYAKSGASRLHVPGHKGVGPLGCEALDITEIAGAGALYEGSDIIAESEKNASTLFASGATFYSAEGSSLCVRAMLYLAMTAAPSDGRPLALAARNAHKSFLYAAALCDFDVAWLWPEAEGGLCACPVSPGGLQKALDALPVRPFCVYLTSPDYLGGLQDIRGLSAVCHAHGVPLIVDNAHGAYLKFLRESLHPLDLGADLCCDSAHKTLPALTGAAYLHIAKGADPRLIESAPLALSLFASTSPSWLILQSLDLLNPLLAGEFPGRLDEAVGRVDGLKRTLAARGYDIRDSEPMKLTLTGNGPALEAALRAGGVECEYADRDHAVLMFSPNNGPEDYERIRRALAAPGKAARREYPHFPRPGRVMTVREATFAPSEEVPAALAVGRVCAAPAVACPPAIPIAVSGEVITPEAAALFEYYSVPRVRVVRERPRN